MIVGMDFGTTNSGMAVVDGDAVRVLPLDPVNANPRVARTAVYITNDQQVHIGRAAVDLYYEQNIGRAVKMQRVWIGELEIYGGDMYYVTDAYAWVDVLSPGRLFLSLKSGLRDQTYAGTVVGQTYYPLEDLIALYLTVTRVRAEQLLGRPIRQVVLGRPVRFAHDDEHDRLAQARLLQAAFRAGYEQVSLQVEPVAAAFGYEAGLDREQHVLVFDFGGGTLDITVMRLGDRRRRQVLATGGIPVAGDVFDQKLVRAKLPRHFGEGTVFGPRHEAREVPRWIYDSFLDWQKMLALQSAENRQMLQDIARRSRHRFQIEALIALVSSNYGLKMFDVVEQAKRRLSARRGAEIRLEGTGFKVIDFVTRTEFEGIIRAEIRAIETHLQETVRASGLQPDAIDAVIRTGGSAQIPAFYEMLCRLFGEEKVQSIDTFSSVTAGLGVIARELAAGELALPVHTPDSVRQPDLPDRQQPTVPPVNLRVMQRRILLTEGALKGEAVAETALVGLDAAGGVVAAAFDAARLLPGEPLSLVDLGFAEPPGGLLLAGMDETVLLISNAYRFLRLTPRQLLDMQAARLTVRDQVTFGKREWLCHAAPWDRVRMRARLVLATTVGLVRPYPLPILRENLETPVPLKFDQPLAGDVLAAAGSDGGEALLLLTAGGRGLRVPVDEVRLSGVQALNCGADDRVAAALLTPPEGEALLVTADGYGRRLRAADVPAPEKVNDKGRSLVARRSPLAAAARVVDGYPAWLLTTRRLVPVDATALPLTSSTRTERLLKLEADETVTGVLAAAVQQIAASTVDERAT